MMNVGFVPQGHARIIPIRVIHAWHHEASGTWLSIQSLGPSMGLVWRVSDSWGATPCLSRVVCDTLDAAANYEAACKVAEELLKEGPPPDLLANALRSALERSKKATKAAHTRWGKQEKGAQPSRKVVSPGRKAPLKQAISKTATKQAVKPAESTIPSFDGAIWQSFKVEKEMAVGLEIRHRKLPVSIFLVRRPDTQVYSVLRCWRVYHENVFDTPKFRVPFAEARIAAEAFAADGPVNWHPDESSLKHERCWLLP